MPRVIDNVFGKNAALALAAHRPKAIQRVLYAASAKAWVGPLAAAAERNKAPCREVSDEAVARAAGTVHHEGVAVEAEPLALGRLASLLPAPKHAVIVALDEVGNPHNLGAILRSAAYFGAHGMIVPSTDRQATLSPAAMRVAQGGAEVVPVVGVERLDVALKRLAREGFAVVAADVHGGEPLSALAGPVCIVLGNEGTGLHANVLAACTKRVNIPGSGDVESLNVSVAAGILLAATRSTVRVGA